MPWYSHMEEHIFRGVTHRQCISHEYVIMRSRNNWKQVETDGNDDFDCADDISS